MTDFEVPQPIICSPFEEPARHWHLEEGVAPEAPRDGRRPAGYFLTEARRDFLQGISIPVDEPSDKQKTDLGYRAWRRHACKMATGSGKTTVMGLITAWSILNKVNDRSNAAYSDAVLIVCPNVTIRSRLAELDPKLGDASLYRKSDLVPAGRMMADLMQGDVVITNWHNFEPHSSDAGGVSGRVVSTSGSFLMRRGGAKRMPLPLGTRAWILATSIMRCGLSTSLQPNAFIGV